MKELYYKHIAQGALTNSKRKEGFVEGVYPLFAEKAYGCFIECNGEKYIDFICGLGTNLVGYANGKIIEAALEAMHTGMLPSLSTMDEAELISLLHVKMPFLQQAKILKTGSDACSAAIKIARAFTGKSLVLSEGYHGWHDDFISLTKPAAGVTYPRSIMSIPTDFVENWDLLDKEFLESIACIIVEPIMTDISEERIIFLRTLRNICSNLSILLIFDEVITGFRFPKFSVSSYYEIYPDLICLGKALGNGFPISVVGGRKDVMSNPDYFVSSTFAGERTSIRAAIALFSMLKENSLYRIDNLWAEGQIFQERFNSACKGVVQIQGYPTRGVIVGDDFIKALFFQEAVKAKILFGPSFFFNFDHIRYKEGVLSALGDITNRIKRGEVQLEGKMPRPPFAQKMRSS
jgi:glutamate-1-semialdehyde 2,1-aminomutase